MIPLLNLFGSHECPMNPIYCSARRICGFWDCKLRFKYAKRGFTPAFCSLGVGLVPALPLLPAAFPALALLPLPQAPEASTSPAAFHSRAEQRGVWRRPQQQPTRWGFGPQQQSTRRALGPQQQPLGPRRQRGSAAQRDESTCSWGRFSSKQLVFRSQTFQWSSLCNSGCLFKASWWDNNSHFQGTYGNKQGERSKQLRLGPPARFEHSTAGFRFPPVPVCRGSRPEPVRALRGAQDTDPEPDEGDRTRWVVWGLGFCT